MLVKQPKFKANRDAWGTIRGYVYQVDLTIQRWLELQPDFELELERGEDVDTIHRAMKKRGKTQARLLEQIKARDKNVSLRSSAALGALAYFYEHEYNNTGLNLKYRYVTNAQITKERNSPSDTALLVLWNRLIEEKLSNKDQRNALTAIRGFLKSVRKPREFPDATWQPFSEFIKNAKHQVFDSFIHKVEWLAHQTAIASTDQKIKEILIDKYEIASDQAQRVYEVLFFHVFKLLTQHGIKRLTTDGRDAILAAPHVASSDQALFANISIYLNLSERVDALEKAVSVLQPRALPTASEIKEACRKATERLATIIVDGRKTIDRQNIIDAVNEFLSSEHRYLFMLGPSGTGKSIFAATEAKRLMDEGAIVLLMRGKYFSLNDAAQLIAAEIWPATTSISWQKVVEVLHQNQLNESSKFVLVIDAIDEADDFHAVSSQLTKLHDSLGGVSPAKIRIIVSCRDIAWNRFSQQQLMPQYEGSAPRVATPKKQLTGYTSTTVRISDFTTAELDQALQQIRAIELINPGRFGATAPAHIATFREMLKHPATFDHYSAVRQTSGELSVQEITWTYLIDQRIKQGLKKAARECPKDANELRKLLEQMAVISWQAGSKNLELSLSEVASLIPQLTDKHKENHSPLAALIENRVLSESQVAMQTRIGFHTSDIGAYLLSFELERQTNKKNPTEVRESLKHWLNESWNFPPLLDALLALLDRFLDQPYNSASLALLEVIVDSQRFHSSSIFELMRPEVLKTIFEIIKQDDIESFYDYRDAALGVRPSPVALAESRAHLKDENALARQLAAELAGAHRDEIAIDQLIELLRDSNDEVQDKTFRAFGHIGPPAVIPLLRTIEEKNQPVELRSSCITALRNVGLRTPAVSAALKRSLKPAKIEPEILGSSLLAAAGLRDRGHNAVAKNALRNEKESVVLAAGKYLAEVPDPRAFIAVRELLKPQPVDESKPYRRAWVINQAITALWETNKTKAAPVLLALVDDSLRDQNELQPVRAVHVTEKVDLPALSQLVFKHLIKKLQSPGEKLVWESAKVIGSTWRTDHLNALMEKNRELLGFGIDIAKLFVDAIIPGIQESDEFRIGDRLNRVSDLSALAKCHVENFAPEAARLIEYTSALGFEELSRLLWICGDTRVEGALIHRFENPSEEREAIHERGYSARALGTCGEEKGAQIVLNYLRERGEELLDDFPQTTLYPLLTRNLLDFKDLSEVATDAKKNWWSRASSLIALSLIDAEKFGELYTEVADHANDEPRLQAQAVRLLYFSKSLSKLRKFLGKSIHSSVRAQAAECLAWLDDASSVHVIERAFEESWAPGFASSLAHFHQESSVSILLSQLTKAPIHWRPECIQALGAFWKSPKGKVAIMDQFDRWSDPEERYLNNQAALISGLVDNEPDVILDQFNRSFDDGYLTTTARETMGKKLADLFYRKHGNEVLILETAKRLLSDKHVPARERAAHALGFANSSICLRLYKEMHDASSADEWERSCAVYSLGFWDSPISLIEAARYDEELLVRRSADSALAVRLKKPHLERHFEQYNTQSGLTRLCSYLCLAEQGDQSTIWILNDNKRTSPFARTFRGRLYKRIERRLADEYKKKLEEEKKLPDQRGMIAFD